MAMGGIHLLHTVLLSFLLYSGYPEPGYSDNMDCQWFIDVGDPNAILEITIHRLRLEQNCKYDRLEIFEGDGHNVLSL